MIHFTLVPDIFICCQSTKKGWLDRKTRHRKKSYETLNKMFEGKKVGERQTTAKENAVE